MRRHDSLLVADEGHNGFLPCGDWFVCDTESLKHDTITFVEGAISAYVPLAGVLTNAETAERMREKQPSIGHFSGIPVGCAAGLAALEEYGRMMENVRRLEPRLHEEFSELEECNVVGDARGRGFLWCT